MKAIFLPIAIFTMFFVPLALVFFLGGQADGQEGDLDKTDYQSIEISVYKSSTGEKITLDLEEYVCGVIMSEGIEDLGKEAMKALAVAIRSYSCRRLYGNEKYTEHFSADFCDDYTHCLGFISYDQARYLMGEQAENTYSKIRKCVEETRGEVLCFEDKIADTVFHISSKDYTESARNIWGFDVPYLVSVKTNGVMEKTEAKYSENELYEILEANGIYFDSQTEPTITLEKDEKGRVEFVLTLGAKIRGLRFAEIFGFKSTCFDAEYLDGQFSFEIYGSGHGVGLSQMGAVSLESEGMGYREILKHYYVGTELKLYSAEKAE